MKFISIVFAVFFLNNIIATNSYLGYSATLNTNHFQEDIFITPNPLIKEYIKNYLITIENSQTIKLGGEKISGNIIITNLYNQVHHKPLWSNLKNRKDLVKILDNAYYEGLNSKDYHVDFIKKYNTQIQRGEKLNPDKIAVADIIMTDAILTYSYHLIRGKVHPVKLDPNWNYSSKHVPDSAEFKLLHCLKTNTLQSGIDSICSELPLYQKLCSWFAKYDSIHKAGGEVPSIKYPGKALKLGDSLAAVKELKISLRAYEHPIDTIDNKFDEDLESALIKFQIQNGLESDGIAGKNTYKALNISIKERLDIIRVNLERVRWLNNELPPEFLLVNIADFNLYIYRNKQIDYRSRVVVGKEQHQTPVFTSQINYLVFNPTWTVPYSIATKEILPKLKHDSLYLQNRNMTLLSGGSEINPSTVDFSKFSERNFPYTIRQEPGSNNALGQVKFIFPNKHTVYLHDTPSKSYFSRTERAFSHGCIRVHNPLLLVEELLGSQGYNQKKISQTLKTKKQQNVHLKKAMTVMILYMTCYENYEDHEVYFYRDIYGRDKKLLSELKKPR